MGEMSDKISNKAQELGGKVKEEAGKAAGDDELAAEGRGDQAESKLKQLGADAKDFAESAADKVKDIFKK